MGQEQTKAEEGDEGNTKRKRGDGGMDIDEVCEDLQPIPRSLGMQWGASNKHGEMMLHGKPVNEEILEVGE